MQFVTVSTNGSGAVPAVAMRSAGGKTLVVYASGVARIVSSSQVAPATQTEIIEYTEMAEGYART